MFLFLLTRRPPRSTLFPYTTLFRSNSGAIASSGLIHCTKGKNAFDYIRATLGRFAGRDLDVDESVFASERDTGRSEEHTSELQTQFHLVCRLLLEKKNKHIHHHLEA